MYDEFRFRSSTLHNVEVNALEAFYNNVGLQGINV